jgi:hypothetical protein
MIGISILVSRPTANIAPTRLRPQCSGPVFSAGSFQRPQKGPVVALPRTLKPETVDEGSQASTQEGQRIEVMTCQDGESDGAQFR